MDEPVLPTQTRFSRRELKFVLDAEQGRRMLADLLAYMAPDPHGDPEGRYPVVDLYYDNRFHDVYWDSATGVASRQKLRLRVYGGGAAAQPISFLELKHKLAGRVYKQRVAVPIEEALAVTRGEWPAAPLDRAGRAVVEQIHALAARRELRPSCVLRYDRQALFRLDGEADLRITFDTDVRFRIDDLVPAPDDRRCPHDLLSDATVVMEVKVDEAMPRWLAVLIASHHCLRASHSKYGRAFETIYRRNGSFVAERLAWQAHLAS